MKQKIVTGLVAAFLLLIGVYIYADQTFETEEQLSADHLIFEDYNDAVNYSDLVLEVTATGDSVNVIEKNETGHTLTNVIINRVIEQKPQRKDSYTLERGSAIKVLEPTYTISNGIKPGVTRLNSSNYTRLSSGSTYVLFLVWDENRKGYWINSSEQGKFNIDNTDPKEQTLTDASEQYGRLKEDVLKSIQE